MARERLPDVVLLDLMLPDINGFDVCRRLRTDRTTMLIPIVMLTALNDVQHRVHGFRVGANAYVTKPYGVDDLFEAIDGGLRLAQQHRQPGAAGRDSRRDQQRDQFPPGPERLLDAGLPIDAAGQRPGRAASAGRHGNGPQCDRVGQPPPVGSPGQASPIACTTTAWKSWFATKARASIGRRLPHAAIAGDPFTHLDVREKLGLRAGGFGLLICQGMVDEMRYNDQGNEVTLIKRFAPSRPLRQDGLQRELQPARTATTNRGNVGSPSSISGTASAGVSNPSTVSGRARCDRPRDCRCRLPRSGAHRRSPMRGDIESDRRRRR